MQQKVLIKTYGCQMNVYDSNRMQDLFLSAKFAITEDLKDANLVILNTCNIREKAAEKVYSELGRVLIHKKKNNMIIAVAGCTAQAEGEEIFNRAPYVDIVVGPQSYHTLPELYKRAVNGEKKLLNLNFVAQEKFDYLPEELNKKEVSNFLSVQEGCNKFCSFCVVPYTRGAEFSRNVSAVYREAVRLAAHDTKELILLGQNVNAYHGIGPDNKTWSLGKLIKLLAQLGNIERISYTTSHPRDMHDELFEAHAEEKKLLPFLHLPVQSGSNKILKSMNRKHTIEEYIDIIDKLKKSQPNIAFSSDFIVGFPGETEEDFLDTMAIVEKVGFIQSFSFKYSPRPGTPGADKDQVAEEIKSERLYRLQDLINKKQHEFNHNMLGQTLSVLLDKHGKYEGQLTGKSQYTQAVHVNAPEKFLNKIVNVKITEILSNSLAGEII